MMKKKLESIIKYPLTVLFAAGVCLIFVLYIVLPDVEFSSTENRFLQGRPGISWSSLSDGSFMKKFETYTDEQIPFRTIWIGMKAQSEALLCKNENNSIVLGADGYLFEKELAPSKQAGKNVETIIRFAASEAVGGRNVVTAIAPTASRIYADKVPKGMPITDQSSYEKLMEIASAKQKNIVVTDMVNKLAEHRNEYLYYRTDHHWTTQGAYYAYEEVCEDLGREPVDITQLERHSIDNFFGTLYAKYKGNGCTADVIDYYDISVESYSDSDGNVYDGLYDIDAAETYDKYALFMHGNPGCGIIRSANCDNGELIVIKDSYANCLIPFLTYNYGTIITIDPRYMGDSVAQLAAEHDGADILILFNWKQFAEDKHLYKLLK